MLIGVRGAASRCFSAPPSPIHCSPSLFAASVPQGLAPPPWPRCAAGRSIRPLRVLTLCLPTRAYSCVVLDVRRCKGGDGGAERGRGGRLFEVTEISMTDDKMLMEEMVTSIAWFSTGVMQTEALDMLQPMYGSTDRCSSARSP